MLARLAKFLVLCRLYNTTHVSVRRNVGFLVICRGHAWAMYRFASSVNPIDIFVCIQDMLTARVPVASLLPIFTSPIFIKCIEI